MTSRPSPVTADEISRSFLYSDGQMIDLNVPGDYTVAEDINDFGQIVGWYQDAAMVQHGFVAQNGTFTTIDNPLGVKGTTVQGINDDGQIVGTYTDAAGTQHGFVSSLVGGNTATEDTPYLIMGITVADVDAGVDPISLTLAVSHGTLTLSDNGGATVTGMGTSTLTITGEQGDINAALAPGLTYMPAPDFNGSDALSVTASDLGHNGAGGPLYDTEILQFTVVAVNDSSILAFDALGVSGEAITGTAGDDILAGTAGDDVFSGLGGSDTFKLQPGGYDVVTDFAAGPGGDKLDISDLLVGYTPGTSVLADYLQLAPAGGDTVVSVDRDGGGGTYSSQAVATLQGVTGLLLNDLEANGNLVVA